MRNRTLHDLLAAFAEEAAAQLAADAADGVEVPFEVVEERGSRSPLYCYRPLTGLFIRERIGALARLPAYEPAARSLELLDGLDDYLRLRGEVRIPAGSREQADASLRALLASVHADTSDFAFRPDRFERAYRELETAVYEGRSVTTVIAPVLGLALESAQLPLGGGLALVRGDTVPEAPPEAVWGASGDPERPSVLAVLSDEGRPGATSLVTAARSRFRRLLTALRLFEAGGFALGPTAWSRNDAGPWQLVALGGSGRPRGVWRVAAAQEDELRGFCNLIARRAPRGGEVAWALVRFELGCERVAPFEALTDHLLALRALLEPEGPGSARLAHRLAAICALGPDRAALAERVAHAVSLERAVIAGLAPPEPGVDALVEELAHHLRALLRDVLCGHLDSDVRRVADELIEEASGEGEGAFAPVPTAAG